MKLKQKDELYLSVFRATMSKAWKAAEAAGNAAVKRVSEAEVKDLPNVEEIPTHTYVRILTVAEVREIAVQAVKEM